MTRTSASSKERFESLSTDQIELVKLLLEKESREARRIRRFPRPAGTALLPTSWAQERLWFIDHLEGGSSAYHISHAVRLRGVLDQQALQNALNSLLSRHEVLRTVFECVDGVPQQRVIPESNFNLISKDLRAVSAGQRERQLQAAKTEELHAHFDLQTGPLIRGRLLWLRDGEYVLIITMHHIVSDGWSMSVLVREVSELYNAEVQAHPASLGELPIQYSDYAQWQREWLRGKVLDEQLNYWRDQLQGANPQLELQTDRPRPQVQSYRGANLPVALDAQLTAKVTAFAQRHDITLFMALLSAWSILLSRLSGQDDVVIGTPIANRQRAELEGMIGFFVNTLALRVPVASDVTVAAFIQQVKGLTLRAYSHQDIPFEKIVEALQPQRSLSRNPIFQAMLAVQNSPAGKLALTGLDVSLEEGIDEPSLFDILLSLEVRDGHLVGVVNYATDLFDRTTVQGWFECFKVLLRGLTESDEAQVGDLPILPEPEIRRLQSFNTTQVARNQNVLVHELFEEQVRRTPDVVAVMHEGASLTYAELNRRANQLARHLLNEDVGPDQLVGVCVERCLEMVVGLLAILKAGGAYLPLDPNYPPERLRHMLSDAAPRVVLTQEELRPILPATEAQIIVLGPTLEEVADRVAENISAVEIGLSAQNLVYVIYTSGSTGRPKGTAMPHGSITNLLEWHQRTLPLQSGERVLQFAALSFDVAFQEIFTTLCGGGTLVLLDEWVRKDARALAQLLSRNSIERLFVPPLVLQSLAESCQSTNVGSLSLKDVITAGEQLRITPEIVDLFGRLPDCRLHNHYGPTETHVVTALTLTRDTRTWPSLPSIGRPVSNTQIHILDPRDRSVPVGVVGEIFIGGANVARGYLDRPELTKQRFVDWVAGSARCYRTGDLGRWRADGTIEYLGRNDDQVKIRGFRIELGEIETHLSKHGQVKDAAVVAREDAPGQKRLVAYVVPRDSTVPSVEDLRRHFKSALPEHMAPSAFVMLEKLPLSPNGKLDRRALPAPELNAYVSRQFEEPQGEIEQTLARIWGELLRVPRVGRHDNFFELGGHSLLMVQMMERLRRAGLSVEVRDVYVSSTLADLAQTLAGAKEQSYEVPPNRIPVGCEKITPEMLTLVDLEPQHIERIVQVIPGGAQNIQDIYPLAPLQEGILFHHLLNEHSGDTYVLPMLLSIPSRPKFQEFIQGLQDVIDRHDILRTAVMWEDLPRALQVVCRKAVLPVVELALDPGRDPVEQLKERMTPEQQKLNLRQAPMMKLHVAYEPQGQECYALLQLHHLTCDHESLEVMLSEVAAYMSGSEEQLPQPTPYRNHVAQALEHARKHDAQAFFRGKLSDVDEPTAPFGLLDVHGGGTRIEEAYQTLNPEFSRQLREQARRLSVSAATLFHAAWALVVARTSGRDDVVFGSVLLGRLQGTAGAQQTLGMFINTLPMRLRLEGLTAKKLVENTQRELIELLNHEQASLAEAQRCANITGSTPLFNSLLNYRHSSVNFESGVSRTSDVKLIASQGWTNFPLMLSVDVRGDDFVLEMATDRRIDPRQLLGHMETSLRSLVDSLSQTSETPVLRLPVLPETELHQLEAFNATQVVRNQTALVHRLFEEQAGRTPDVVAVLHEGISLTYGELNRRANQLARRLKNEGVGPDQVVGVCVERSLEMVVGLLSIVKAGGAYLPLDPNYPPERLKHMLDDALPRVVLTQESLRSILPATEAQIIVLADGVTDQAAENSAPVETGVTAENLVYVIYTSGSTGRPKGTAMSHGSMTNLIEWHRRTLPLKSGERVLQFAALSFDVAFQEIFTTLCTGGTLVLLDEWIRKDARALAQLLNRSSIERLFVPPLVLQSLAECWQAAGDAPASLKDVITAGEQLRISPEIVDFFEHLRGSRLHNHYGPTETHVVTALTLEGEPRKWPSLPSIGRPVSNTQIHILDTRGELVPVGVIGEVFIGGAGVARGYLGRPELTKQRFIHGIAGSERCYRTGDVGRWRADGTIEYLGRNDDQVKIRGFRIELGEIEVHLGKQPQVKEAAVIAREDVPGEKRLVAYVVPRDAGGPSVEQLRAHVKESLPEHMVPSAFVMLEKLPLNPNGKLDRRALPTPELGAYVSRQFEEPQGPIEQTLAKIWGELLRVSRVGRHDNFFELGGHSLLMVQMMERLRRAGLSATVRRIYDSSTLSALAESLANERAETFVVPPNRIPAGAEEITPEMLTLVDLEPQHIERIARAVSGGVRNIQDIYPLAPLQEGMLFHHLLSEKRGDTYVLPIQLALSSRDKVNDLVNALQRLIDRHDILRTAVLWEQLPRPVQVVSRRATLPVEELVLDPARDPAEQMKEHMAPDQQRLNLQQAPLMKLKVTNDVAGDRCLAILQMHHLVCDHESLHIMFSEVMHYLEQRPGNPPDPVPYREHVAQALEHARKHDAQAFFRKKLGDIDEPTAPFGLLDVHAGANRFEEVRQTLESDLSRQVRSQARRLNVSTAALFHAAWATVVSRTTGRDDVVFGTVLLGRLQGSAGAQQTLGMFMNTLPLRLNLGALGVQELVQGTHRELVELFNHEQASLAEAQRCSGIIGTTPLFSTVLNYRHSAGDSDIESALARNGVEITGIESWTNYPIMLSIDDLNDDFLMSVQTDRRLDAKRLLEYVNTALRSIVDSLVRTLQIPATSLAVMPDAELRLVVDSFNQTQADYPREALIHELFEEQVRRTPGAPAVVCDGQSLSYSQLNARANQLARHLIECGLRPEQLVGICVPRRLEMVIGLLGILKAGGAYVALDPDYPADRLGYLLSDSMPRFLLTHPSTVAALPKTKVEKIDLETDWDKISRQPPDEVRPADLGLTSRNLAYVIYTSGSTGKPKGVAIEHRNTVNLVHWARSNLALQSFERSLFSTSLNFDLSIYECFVPLAVGGCIHLVKNALSLLTVPADVTLINTVPSAIKGVLESAAIPRNTQVINLAGEALKRELVEGIFARSEVPEVCNLYGPSETTTYSTWVSMPRSSGFNESIGRPIANTQIYILNKHLQPVPIGIAGEIFIGGDGVARGYLNRPELTEERFVADPFSSNPNARMYRTGDLAHWLQDGTIQYLSRTDHQVKIRGFRIELGEIETQLVHQPQVKEAVVIAREDIPGEKRLVAYVVAHEAIDAQALRVRLRSILPEHMVPSAIVQLEALPLTPNGKLDRRALPAPEVGAYVSNAYVPPEGPTEEGLAEIWKSILSVKRVGRLDNFFELGGHSLNGIKLIAAVFERFGASISVPMVFSSPTIVQMAAVIGQKIADKENELFEAATFEEGVL